MNLTFITGNPGKAEAVQKYAEFPIEFASVDLPEIQSLDPIEIIQQKAQAAFEHLQKPVLVEDTSLTFPFMGKLPGPFIKWFLSEVKNEGMARLLDQDPERKAIARIVFAVHTGAEIKIFEHAQTGTISQHPKGEKGIGWDAIFIPDGQTLTFAEMDDDTMRKYSLRAIILQEISNWLRTQS